MDLLEKYEEAKKDKEKLEKQEEKISIRRDIANIVSDIIKGGEKTVVSNKKTAELLGIKLKEKNIKNMGFHGYYWGEPKYDLEITKKLIKNVEKYLEKEQNDL